MFTIINSGSLSCVFFRSIHIQQILLFLNIRMQDFSNHLRVDLNKAEQIFYSMKRVRTLRKSSDSAFNCSLMISA